MSAQGPYKRVTPERTRPNRGAGGFYRTAEAVGAQAGGVPLNSANDAVVAAVRLAYKVAQKQVERSTRLARRLREAGDRAIGPQSDRKALDAAEQLVMKSMLSALEWWESSVAEGRFPLKRLAAAEYRMIGTLLGFGTEDSAAAAPPGGSNPPANAERAARQDRAARRRLRIRHEGQRRAVRQGDWELDTSAALDPALEFHNACADETLSGTLSIENKVPVLALRITTRLPAGLWKAAVCSKDGEQVGYIEIVL